MSVKGFAELYKGFFRPLWIFLLCLSSGFLIGTLARFNRTSQVLRHDMCNCPSVANLVVNCFLIKPNQSLTVSLKTTEQNSTLNSY